MNEREYFLTCLGEEGCEIGQQVSKTLRFGINETWKPELGSNHDRLIGEFIDLIAVAKKLKTLGVIDFPFVESLDDPRIDAKLTKLDKYFGYAKDIGTIVREDGEVEFDLIRTEADNNADDGKQHIENA
jgi:hypothetical protein